MTRNGGNNLAPTLSFFRPSVAAWLLLALFAPLGAAEHITHPFVGVALREIFRTEPRPQVIHVAEIDLAAEGLAFLVTPGNGDPNGELPGDPNNETTRQTTLEFLKQHKAQLAINATFFGMQAADTDNLGLVVSRGERVSPFRENWPAINIDPDHHVAIIQGVDDTYQITSSNEPVKLYNAVCGSDQIVTDGKETTDDREFSTTPHPRTAIGLTGDNRLILVTVDGRQAGYAEGMKLAELAELLIDLGCVQGLNLDGGGSTTMAIADPEPRVLNRPSGKTASGAYGVLRKNAASLAIFAQPKPDYQRSDQNRGEFQP